MKFTRSADRWVHDIQVFRAYIFAIDTRTRICYSSYGAAAAVVAAEPVIWRCAALPLEFIVQTGKLRRKKLESACLTSTSKVDDTFVCTRISRLDVPIALVRVYLHSTFIVLYRILRASIYSTTGHPRKYREKVAIYRYTRT